MKILCAIIFVFLFCACNTPAPGLIEKAVWLTGTWENKTEQGILYESWQRSGEKELKGKSYFLDHSDTMVVETVQLVEQEDKLCYIVTAINSNNELPVRFCSVTLTGEQLIFENAAHDYPQVISYQKIGTDSLVAEISAKTPGGERKQIFPMKKVK